MLISINVNRRMNLGYSVMFKKIRGTGEWVGSEGTLCAISSPAIRLPPGRRRLPRLGEVRLLFERSR